ASYTSDGGSSERTDQLRRRYAIVSKINYIDGWNIPELPLYKSLPCSVCLNPVNKKQYGSRRIILDICELRIEKCLIEADQARRNCDPQVPQCSEPSVWLRVSPRTFN